LFSYPFPFISEGEHDSSSEEESKPGDSDSLGLYHTPSPIFPLCAKRKRLTTPDPDYVLEDQPAEQPRRITRRLLLDTKKQPLVESLLDMVTSSKSINVRKSGQVKRNKLHASIFIVTTINKYGKPPKTKGINAKWCNDCGTLVREIVWVTFEHWRCVPSEKKKELWKAMKDKYIFPTEVLDRDENATLYTMRRALRTFRCNLNKDYVKKGIKQFNDFGFITPDDWNTFVNQRTSNKALEVC
jgi:hypothetical protein